MNKRIEQLAGQLGPVATVGDWGRVEWADNVYPQRGDKMYAAVDLAKFAELIVQECIDQVEQAKNSSFVSLDDAKRMAHFVDVTTKKIQTHFRS
jgi:hypothetical protein